MITETQFDAVFDCQQVFKTLMNTLARPGTIGSIADSTSKIAGENAPLMAAGLALLDNWRKFFVFGDEELKENLRELTYGVPSPLEEADYLFVAKGCLDELNCHEILSQAKIGTLAEPHKSATIFIMLDSLTGGEESVLTGPGVKESIQITLPETGRIWVEERQRMNFEFPCGLELYFMTPQGEVMGIPRKIKIGGENKWDMLQ